MTVSHEGLLEWINEPQTRPRIMPDDLRVNPRIGSKLEMGEEHKGMQHPITGDMEKVRFLPSNRFCSVGREDEASDLHSDQREFESLTEYQK